MRTRFSQYFVGRMRIPASFWLENVKAVFILLRAVEKCPIAGNKFIKCEKFYHFASGRGLNFQ